MSENKVPSDIVAMLDQMETMWINLARALGKYHSELINSGIPEELANKMVIDMQSRVTGGTRNNG